MMRIVLVHGAATTGAVWDPVLALLDDLEVSAPDRPCSGNLETELAWLESHASGALVAGMSGGATLALGLASRVTAAAAIIAHEPAVGSLLPELLAEPGKALAEGGVAAFGRTLYGDLWHPAMARDGGVVPSDFAVPSGFSVRADVAMFRAFEPAAPHEEAPVTLVTTGELSPPLRHDAAARLNGVYGYWTATLPGARHFVAQESPATFAALVRDVAAGLSDS
ncbi:MAG: hypothetical protein CVT64_08090 [Actinobacteria bacterium HGW-Actinobacteria-4]|nr:MAG: hypothetical protein CVT64_08090 [Actinobacteria bacterium HGW-Actinobacteria-4]